MYICKFETKCHHRAMSQIITLTTDWGNIDPYAAIFKAHVWKRFPEARLVDITHEVERHNLNHAAYLLGMAYPHFPPGSVHLADVRNLASSKVKLAYLDKDMRYMDPLAIRYRDHLFLVENNGLFSMICPDFEEIQEMVKLPVPDEDPYKTFPALASFAPAAAALAENARLSLQEIGESYPLEKLLRERLLKVNLEEKRIICHLTHTDHYGNIHTDLRMEDFLSVAGDAKKMQVQIPGYPPLNVVLRKRFTPRTEGDFVMFNLAGYMEIGRVQAPLAFQLGLEDERVLWSEINILFDSPQS